MNPALALSFSARLSLGLLLALVAGCAGVPAVVPAEKRAGIERTYVRSFLPQGQLTIQSMRSSYAAAGGLLGAIVDVSVSGAMASSAEARAVRLREAVKDHDFRSEYWRAISNAVWETAWLKVGQWELLASNVARVTPEMVGHQTALNLGTEYFISPDMRVLHVNVGLNLFLRGQHKKPAAWLGLRYQSAEIGKEEGDKALELWMADQGALFRRTVEEGIREQAALLRLGLDHLGGAGTNGRPAKIHARLIHGRGDLGIPTSRMTLWGRVVEERPDRVIFQVERGDLFSFPRQDIEVEYFHKD